MCVSVGEGDSVAYEQGGVAPVMEASLSSCQRQDNPSIVIGSCGPEATGFARGCSDAAAGYSMWSSMSASQCTGFYRLSCRVGDWS